MEEGEHPGDRRLNLSSCRCTVHAGAVRLIAVFRVGSDAERVEQDWKCPYLRRVERTAFPGTLAWTVEQPWSDVDTTPEAMAERLREKPRRTARVTLFEKAIASASIHADANRMPLWLPACRMRYQRGGRDPSQRTVRVAAQEPCRIARRRSHLSSASANARREFRGLAGGSRTEEATVRYISPSCYSKDSSTLQHRARKVGHHGWQCCNCVYAVYIAVLTDHKTRRMR